MITIIFFFSMFVMFAMIASKAIEMKTGRSHLVSHIFRSGDVKVHAILDDFIYKYNRYKKIARIFVFEFLPSYVYEILTKLRDYVSKKYYSVENGIRGRRVLRSNGSVSFFLGRLSEEKGSSREI